MNKKNEKNMKRIVFAITVLLSINVSNIWADGNDALEGEVIGYDLAVLGNAGLDSLEKWQLKSSVEPQTQSIRNLRALKRGNTVPESRSRTGSLEKEQRYYKLNGAHAVQGKRVKQYLK